MPKRKTSVSKRPSSVTVLVGQGDTPREAEKEAFAALMVQGFGIAEAYQRLHPEADPDVCYSRGYTMAVSMADRIRTLKQARERAASVLLGLDFYYYLKELKEGAETVLEGLTPSSRFCKKYKVTTRTTKDGCEETIEVEKVDHLSYLKQIGDALAFHLPAQGSPAALAMAVMGGEPTEGTHATVEDALKSIFVKAIAPGLPSDRRVAAARDITPEKAEGEA